MGTPAHSHPAGPPAVSGTEPSSQGQWVLPQPWPQGEGPGPWAAGFLWPVGLEGALGSHGKDPLQARGSAREAEGVHIVPAWRDTDVRGGGLGVPERRGQAAGTPLPPPPPGALCRTGRHYQELLPVSDYLLYFLNPLQELLEEERRGGGQSRRSCPAPHILAGERSEVSGSQRSRGQRGVSQQERDVGRGGAGGSGDRCARSQC